ncbi:Rieske [2Fe-2S] iron-sulfur domain-containing protein, partial [Obelidium mucronatum]
MSEYKQTQEELEEAYYSESNTNLRNCWYPLLLGNAVKAGTPYAHHLLGDPIVLYRDPETNDVIVFADKCPHRSAPLSVGRIMDGKLECRYHGWQFSTDGVCSKVPSSSKIPTNAKVRKYPAVESEGFIWIWPGDLEAVNKVPKPVIYFPKLKEEWVPRIGYEVLDIDASLLNENFLDPAHLPFTHDTTIGKRGNSTIMNITCEFIDKTNEGHGIGIQGSVSQPERPDLMKIQQKFQFMGPCIVSLDFGDLGDQTFYSIPTRKGHCHFVYIQRFSFMQFLEKQFWGRWILDWYNPSYVRKILMEDYEMLKGQQERLAVGANAMNSPVAADLMIKTYRNWWRKVMKREDGGPWFAGYSSDIEDICLDDNRSKKVGKSASGRVATKKKQGNGQVVPE